MSTNPPTRRPADLALGPLIASLLLLTACSSMPPSADVDGLLVATGDRLLVTNPAGDLGPFDGPPGPVAAVAAAVGRVVAVSPDGQTTTSDGGGTWRRWRTGDLPPAEGGPPLVALSPDGRRLASVVGDLQGERFDLVLVDLEAGGTRTVAIDRGVNGPPGWLDGDTIAIDVVLDDGSSAIASIGTDGTVRDRAGPGLEVAASGDSSTLALVDDAGDAAVAPASGWRTGGTTTFAQLAGPDGSTAEHVAIDGAGRRVGVVRRLADGTAAVEAWVAGPKGWSLRRSVPIVAADAISIAWLR